MTRQFLNILHVTDLHIAGPKSEKDLLRRDHYEEYIDGLAHCISENFDDRIDCAVATGDYVECGKVDNFSHAEKVVTYLAGKLNLDARNVAVCIGNHDLLQEEDKKKRYGRARARYKKFANKFSNGEAIRRYKRWAVLCAPRKGVKCLMIDTTLGSWGKNCPGTLTVDQTDKILNLLKTDATIQEELLVIGTHHLAENFPRNLEPFEDPKPGWHEKHLWTQGTGLKEGIIDLRKGAATVWLCGDIHSPGHVTFKDENMHFVATGRFGTATGRSDSRLARQVKIISIEVNKKSVPNVLTFNYGMPGSESQPHYGSWTCERGTTTIIYKRKQTRRGRTYRGLRSSKKASNGGTSHIVIDQTLQDEIIETIKKLGLYKLGRFSTSGDKIHLSWVSVGPLLSSGVILARVVNSMVRWLSRQFEKDGRGAEETVLLGIDCWGAVLASQISVQTGAWNFCLGARGQGEHHTSHEKLSASVYRKIRQCKNIVFVTDVIASGRSLNHIYEQIKAELGEEQAKDLRWFALSVIADESIKRNTGFLKAQGTTCGALRMPILAAGELPDESILPPNISFI